VENFAVLLKAIFFVNQQPQRNLKSQIDIPRSYAAKLHQLPFHTSDHPSNV